MRTTGRRLDQLARLRCGLLALSPVAEAEPLVQPPQRPRRPVMVTGIPASSQKALLDQISALGTNMLQATAAPNQQSPVRLPPESVEMVSRIGPVSIASAVANTHATVHRSDHADRGRPGCPGGACRLAGRERPARLET
jgi:hypothetical protein